jgi:hypothetical protein
MILLKPGSIKEILRVRLLINKPQLNTPFEGPVGLQDGKKEELTQRCTDPSASLRGTEIHREFNSVLLREKLRELRGKKNRNKIEYHVKERIFI